MQQQVAHREPGVFGAAWLNKGLNTEMIVDGVHSSCVYSARI